MCGTLRRLDVAWKRGNGEPYFAEAYCVAEDLGDTSLSLLKVSGCCSARHFGSILKQAMLYRSRRLLR